jgi:hypothetical protein
MLNVGGHKVYETLPAGMVDLDKCAVCSWPVAEEEPSMIDDVVESGLVVLYNTESGDYPLNIYWGKTDENPHGFCDTEGYYSYPGIPYIVVDAPAITKDILLALYVMNVIPE